MKVELYDSHRTIKMGKELGYMGLFPNVSEALDYFESNLHLFEGWPEIEIIEETEDEK